MRGSRSRDVAEQPQQERGRTQGISAQPQHGHYGIVTTNVSGFKVLLWGAFQREEHVGVAERV